MNYIGSKFSLLSQIQDMIEEKDIDKSGIFCDIFSGTSAVAQLAKEMGFTVVSNDIQAYSYATQKCFIESNGYPAFSKLRKRYKEIDKYDVAVDSTAIVVNGKKYSLFGISEPNQKAFEKVKHLARVVAFLDSIPAVRGLFSDAYCEGGTAGRNYFSKYNGEKCEAIRDFIEHLYSEKLLSEIEYHILVAILIESMDMVANTASVYGAFLKHIKKVAQSPVALKIPLILNGNRPHKAYQEDANQLIKDLAKEFRGELLYIDPPYNRRQYCSNYHILETIARWDLDTFSPSGVTGLRPQESQRSRFSLRRQAEDAFTDLIENANFKHIIVSYSNEGIVPEETLRDILERKSPSGVREFRKIDYKRFRADNDGDNRVYAGDAVQEFLFYVKCE